MLFLDGDTMSLNGSIFTHVLMKKIGRNESFIVNMVYNKTTKLAVLLVVVGAIMIFLAPMLTEKVDARTVGHAQSLHIGSDPPFTNVKWHLDAGKWVKFPTVNHNAAYGGSWAIDWVTAGSGVFSGDERGTVEADFGPGRHVIFKWTNPTKGENHCLLGWTGKVFTLPCTITQHSGLYDPAQANYRVSTICVVNGVSRC
jgi:hypothetical protein